MNTSKNNTSSFEGLPNKFMDYWKVEEKFQFEKATRKDCVSTQILQNIVRFSNLRNFKLIKNQPDCLQLKLCMKIYITVCGRKVVLAKLLPIYFCVHFYSLNVFFIR